MKRVRSQDVVQLSEVRSIVLDPKTTVASLPNAALAAIMDIVTLSLDPPFARALHPVRLTRTLPVRFGLCFFPVGRSHPDGALRAGKGS